MSALGRVLGVSVCVLVSVVEGCVSEWYGMLGGSGYLWTDALNGPQTKGKLRRQNTSYLTPTQYTVPLLVGYVRE